VTAYLVRIELRRHWRAALALSLLIGVVVGTVVATLAGANRSASSFDRYLEEVDPPAAMVFGETERVDLSEDIPAVEAAVPLDLVAAFPTIETEDFFPLALTDGGVVPFDRMRSPLIRGRLPDRDAPLEVAVSERTADRLQVAPGEALELATFTQEGWDVIAADEHAPFVPDGPMLDLQVVGIVRDPGDIGSRPSDITLTFLTPAFRDLFGPSEVGSMDQGHLIFLRPGGGLEEVTTALEDEDVEFDSTFFESAQTMAPTMRSIATALRLFALAVSLAGVIAISQVVARMQQGAAGDDPTLGALGASRQGRWIRLVAPGGLAAVVGTVVGLGAAVPASALFPVGLARKAEPDPGLVVDGGMLLLGGVGAVVILVMVIAVPAWWRIRRAGDSVRVGSVSRWGRAAADLGLPAPAVTGLSLAAGTRGRPGRIAVAGTLLSVLGVLAALVFSTSVDRLRSDHELYGWPWDVAIEGEGLTHLDGATELAEELQTDSGVLAAGTLYTQLPVTVDGVPGFGTVVDVAKGDIDPVLVRGSIPQGRDEMALGRDTLDRVGAELGDTVLLSMGDVEVTMRLTGIVALPVPEDGGSSATGIYLSPASVDAFDVDAVCDDSGSCTTTVAVDLAPSVDAETWAARHEDPEGGTNVALPSPPAEIDRLTAVEDLPQYLAAFLALLAAGAISFATATTVRQRQRDLAILRVLGMTRRHVRQVVSALVLALTAAGAVLGGVLGLIVGRQVWRAVMESVALPFAPRLPLLAALLVPIAAIVLAQLVATVSRRTAGRTPAALVLRAE
jgi:hypothetical protein